MFPILLSIGPFTIQSLWLFISLGVLAGILIFLHQVKRVRLNTKFLLDINLGLFISALISARLIFIVGHTDLYFMDTWKESIGLMISIWDQGFSFWGGFAATLVYFIWQAKKNGEPIKEWMDAGAQALLIGLFIGEIGQFLGGSGYGNATNLPWGVTFESAAVKYTVPIHPTQIYAMIYLVVIVWIIGKLAKTQPYMKVPGMRALVTTVLLSGCYFFEEFFRGDDVPMIGILRIPQVVSGILFILTAIILFRKIKSNPAHSDTSL